MISVANIRHSVDINTKIRTRNNIISTNSMYSMVVAERLCIMGLRASIYAWCVVFITFALHTGHMISVFCCNRFTITGCIQSLWNLCPQANVTSSWLAFCWLSIKGSKHMTQSSLKVWVTSSELTCSTIITILSDCTIVVIIIKKIPHLLLSYFIWRHHCGIIQWWWPPTIQL